ncbi:MAG TPA: SGNH/GDSL hydrolase family protein [Terracidiphilus sp.]|jgi:lysophospholipase L1-like esterase
MKQTYICLLTAALFTCAHTNTPAQSPALHDGDRVAFYGDSITAQRLYTRYVEDFVLTRYPQMRVAFFNAGVPGDTVNGGYTGDRATRLTRDLFPLHPTVVTIMLGMNDGYYMPFDPKYLGIFEDGYRSLVKEIQARDPEARFTLISTTPYDEVTHGTEFAHYSESVGRNADFAREFAASSHFPFADFHQKVSDLLESGHRSNPSLAALLVPDRIHPGEAAHWVMAAELARVWGLSPIVSDVHLDASAHEPISAENAHVSGLALKDGSLTWTELDDALPLPLPLHDGMIQFVLANSQLSAMDRELLRVDNLSATRYTLKIDDRVIGVFTRQQLATGVNLALLSTPMESQARDVDGTEQERARFDEAIFNLVIDDPKVDGAAAAAATIRVKDAALADEQRKAAQPKPHGFSLSPE